MIGPFLSKMKSFFTDVYSGNSTARGTNRSVAHAKTRTSHSFCGRRLTNGCRSDIWWASNNASSATGRYRSAGRKGRRLVDFSSSWIQNFKKQLTKATSRYECRKQIKRFQSRSKYAVANYYVIYFGMPQISYCYFLDEPLHRVIDDLKALTTSILDSDSDDDRTMMVAGMKMNQGDQ